MDFLTGNIKRIYFRYLSAAFGSAMITSVYSIVDMAMARQLWQWWRRCGTSSTAWVYSWASAAASSSVPSEGRNKRMARKISTLPWPS